MTLNLESLLCEKITSNNIHFYGKQSCISKNFFFKQSLTDMIIKIHVFFFQNQCLGVITGFHESTSNSDANILYQFNLTLRSIFFRDITKTENLGDVDEWRRKNQLYSTLCWNTSTFIIWRASYSVILTCAFPSKFSIIIEATLSVFLWRSWYFY